MTNNDSYISDKSSVIPEILVQWRWAFFILSLALVALLANGSRYINFATDYEVWFSGDNPQLNEFMALQKTYDKSDNVVFLITPSNGNVFTRETLLGIEWLTKNAWGIPFSTRVDSISNHQYTFSKGDDLIVADLIENAGEFSVEQIASVKRIALNEPQLVNKSISSDGKVTAVNVIINLPKNKPEGSPTVTAYARDLISKFKNEFPGHDVHLTGLVVMDNAFMEASMKDMGTLTLIMFGLIIFGLLILLRSIVGTLIILSIIIMSIMATMGFSGWMGVLLTPVSAGAPTIVMTIVVANAVHILVTMIMEMRSGRSKRDALVDSLRLNLQPVILATVTTVIGFMTMHFSDIPPFHDLGKMVSVGVIVSFVLSIGFMPSLLMLLPMRVSVAKENKNNSFSLLSEFVINKKTDILWVFSAVSIVLFALIPMNNVHDNIWEYFDESVQFRVDTDYASEHLTGPYYLEYSIESNESGGMNSPQYMSVVDDFQKWLYKQNEVVHVSSIADVMKRLNKNLHSDDEGWYKLPEDRKQSAQYMLLYEMSLPYGLDLNNQVNVDKSSTRVVASLHNLSNNEMIDLHRRAEAWLSNNAPQYSVTSGSPMLMFSHISLRTVKQMIIGVVFALCLISILIIVTLKSFKIGVISLIPNLVPPAMAFGIWAVFVGEVGFALAVGLGMTVGIIVDDTVHFMSKYMRARREKCMNAEDSVRYAFENVGKALVITTTVLTIGFSVLLFSTFKSNYELGLITSITIVIALIVDIILLPALLLKFDKHVYADSEEFTPDNSVIIKEQNFIGETK